MIVEVLVAQGDGGDPLGDQGALVMADGERVPGVGDGGVEGVEQADPFGNLAEQQGTGIGSKPSTLEVGDDGLGPEAGKVQEVAVTVCLSGGLAPGRAWSVLTQSLQGVRPPHH